jgi:uncharacterized repeat protein (TIGR01451 family)
MKSRALRMTLTALTCLTLLAPVSTTSAQVTNSLTPHVELQYAEIPTTAAQVNASTQPSPGSHFSDAAAAGSTGELRVRLAVGEFDPLVTAEPAGLPRSMRLSGYPGDGMGYHVVQFSGPIATSDLDALTATGAQVFDYIPDFAFIVKMDNATRTTVEQMKQIRWVGLYQPAYRLPADLLAKTSKDVDVLPFFKFTDGYPITTSPALRDDSPIEIVATIFRGEALSPIIAQIEDMGGVVLDQSQTEWKSKLKVSIHPSRLIDMVAINGVRWVEEAPQWKLANEEAADIMGVREVWDTHGLRGAGQTIAVCDTGLDQGSTSPASLHDDFENGGGSSRVLVIHDGVGDGGSDVNSGHGTHVAGSVLGNGDLSGATPSSHTYPDTAYVGMAPEASLVFQATEDNASGALSGIPNDLNDLFSQAATSGATLHTNSWGSSVMGMYTSSSEEVDEYVWDNKNFTILFSAGNDGIDTDANGVIDQYSMGSPATAKNAITVGASENYRLSGGYGIWGVGSWLVKYPVDPVQSDAVSDDPDGLAAFSSRGPTLDGRFKPDIVAPGTNIASVRSSLASETGWGEIDANYMYMGGTSMATPLAAGAATLVRQYYTDNKGDTPSAALIKATLANGATDIYPGQYGTGATQEIPTTRPTNVAGWGRLNLEGSIFPAATRAMTYTDVTPGLNTAGVDTYKYTIGSSSEPLRVTLAWSDYPGSSAAAGGLVNDLDLKVTGPGGTIYYPNNASQRGDSEHLAYDIGIYTSGYIGSAGNQVGVRFTPSSYPATLQTGLFYLASNSDTYPKTFNWYVYNGSDATGPNTVLASGSTTIRRMGWHPVDLSGAGVSVSSGDFFLAIELPDDDLAWLYDQYPPVDGRSWGYDGASWTKNTAEDYMFHAIVKSADASTTQDRVNNLVGIDIDGPTAGVYTITVSGYNVPQGPQPYALVASGAIGSEPKPDVSISKQVVGSDFAPGDPVAFTLDIANSGTLTATGVVVTDLLPSEVLTPTADSTLTITATGPTSYTWNVEPLVAGASGVITISGWIDPGLGSDFSFVNTATISAPDDDTPGNNTSSVTVGPNVGITKHVIGSGFEPGDTVTFTLTIDNSGNTAASQVTVVDDLPGEVLTPTFDSTLTITPTGAFSYTWTVEPLGVGESGMITIYGRIDASLEGSTSFVNTATISNPGDNTTSNNTSSVTVNVAASGNKIYLPVVMRRWPPIPHVPTLDAISNPDGDGSYTVSWSTADLADTYILQEDDNAAFSSPTTAYSGGGTSTPISGKSAGTYYYRVGAQNAYGDSGWSNSQLVRVLPPTTFYATEDAAVYQGVANTNYGSYLDMWVGYGKSGCGTPSDYKISRSLVKFDLSSIPGGTPISSAQLHLRVGGVCYGGNQNARTTTAYRADGDWSESSVTWNSKPGYAEAYGSASIPFESGTWHTFDVTGLVHGWVNGTYANQGLMIRGPEGSGSTFGWIGFYTSESSVSDPYLSITYAGMDASQETALAVERALDSDYDETGGPSTTSGCGESQSADQAVYCNSPD